MSTDMMLFQIIVFFIGLNIIFTSIVWAGGYKGINGFEFMNPCWIYNHYHVNYFGAALICIIYNLICPVGSICYWIYKLCTVGRR